MSTQMLTFLLGAGAGVFVAQNYKIPDLKTLLDRTSVVLREMERRSRRE